jgi:hypothetical protein
VEDYFYPGDRARLDCIRDAQAALTHPDERFMLDAPTPAFALHRSVTADGNANDVFSATAEHAGRRWPVFFKPIGGVSPSTAPLYGQDSVIDIAIHEMAAWWLARQLGSPWSEIVAPAVWWDPPGADDIRDSGPFLLGMAGSASLPEPGTGFEQLISDAAFFDALIGAQDRHDQNLRATAMPPSLGLIDHGYAFARPGDRHNTFPTAGFFQRLRCGQRHFRLHYGRALDYHALGALSPNLASHEKHALTRLNADLSGLLGIADLLPEDRADALRDRVQRMDQTQEILRHADF